MECMDVNKWMDAWADKATAETLDLAINFLFLRRFFRYHPLIPHRLDVPIGNGYDLGGSKS